MPKAETQASRSLRSLSCCRPRNRQQLTPSHPKDIASLSCLGFHPGSAFDTWLFTGSMPDLTAGRLVRVLAQYPPRALPLSAL